MDSKRNDPLERQAGRILPGLGMLLAALGAAFVFFAASSATDTSRVFAVDRTIPLNNDEAEVGTDCPETGVYWHFVVGGNNSEFLEFDLNLGDGIHNFSTFMANAGNDNVFVEVPAGYELDDLVVTGSTADIDWDGNNPEPEHFQLSHLCPGDPNTPTATATTTATGTITVTNTPVTNTPTGTPPTSTATGTPATNTPQPTSTAVSPTPTLVSQVGGVSALPGTGKGPGGGGSGESLALAGVLLMFAGGAFFAVGRRSESQ